MTESGVFRVVGTPIGNVGDLAPRAREALAKADLILAEDTRTSGALLARLGIDVKLVSCHAHNELDRLPVVEERLADGHQVALISDAGAPAISDPGGRLVQAVADRGYRVEVFPGPSAPIAALMGAGVDASRYAFLGFLPRSGKKRMTLLEGAGRAGLALVVFEAAGRVPSLLADAHSVLGRRRVVVARELTKLHETFHRGWLGELTKEGGPRVEPPWFEKGECVVVVEAGELAAGAAAADGAGEQEIEAILSDRRRPPKARAKALANLLGISTKEAYARVTQSDEGAAGPSPPAEGADDADSSPAVREVREHLAAAARALAKLGGAPEEGAAAGRLPSEIEGADELMVWLDRSPLPVRAPVEARETAMAILAALSAADAFEEAWEMLDDNEARRRGAGEPEDS